MILANDARITSILRQTVNQALLSAPPSLIRMNCNRSCVEMVSPDTKHYHATNSRRRIHPLPLRRYPTKRRRGDIRLPSTAEQAVAKVEISKQKETAQTNACSLGRTLNRPNRLFLTLSRPEVANAHTTTPSTNSSSGILRNLAWPSTGPWCFDTESASNRNNMRLQRSTYVSPQFAELPMRQLIRVCSVKSWPLAYAV